MAQTKCLFLTGSFILLLAAGLSHRDTRGVDAATSSSSSSSSSSSPSRSFGFFNATSLVTILSSTWDLRSTKEVTLRTCHPQGTLLSQNASSSSSSSSSSSPRLTHLALLLRNGTVVFEWTMADNNDDDGDSNDDTETRTSWVSVGEGLADNQQYTVRLRHYLGTVSLHVLRRNQVLQSAVVANASHNSRLLAAGAIRDSSLRVGEGFVGCLYAAPGVNFSGGAVEVENVAWGSCPLRGAPGCSTADGNDCYTRPCQNGGTCVDMFQDYRCECPRNFNGTNCENDLARQYGCQVEPCENNGTCMPLAGVSPGALPYRCTCREGFTGVNCETLLNQCEMVPNPCGQGACTNTINSYTCNCTGTGYRGQNCSEDIDECSEDRLCGIGQCFNKPGGYGCECPHGFNDQNMCQDIDECVSSPCQNGGTCTQGIDNYTCSCVAGYEGVNCQIDIDDCASVTCTGSNTRCDDGVFSYRCVCLDGYENRTGECVDIDECESNPCKNNATCLNQVNNYRCDCWPGFEGRDCQVDIDDCAGQPCQNNGTCVDQVNGFTCDCAPGYTNTTCGTDIDDCVDHQCRNGATCQDQVNSYRCVCAIGWTGERCNDDIDDCASNPCRNNATCNDFVAAYNCTCLSGFTGFNCQTNINDCSPDPCQNGATCEDGVVDYTCHCLSAWMGKNCSEPFDACSFLPCQNNATCSTTVPQREYTCTCLPGFNGTDCENNIDDCVGNTCQPFEDCNDGIGTYTCACPVGMAGERCETEINECESNPCQHDGRCNNHMGFYNCTCLSPYPNSRNYPTGYTGYNCDKDIDECAYDPPICQNGGTCTNHDGSYQCNCIGQTPSGEIYTGLNCDLPTSYCLATGGSPCQHGGTCRSVIGTYTCDCVPGYTDKNCSTDIDDCEGSPCEYNGTCIDRVNGYDCVCIPGTTGHNCSVNINDCEDNPCGYGTCKDKINDYECNCTDTGFEGRNCEKNINDCLPNVCQHNGTCLDGIKNYSCDCLDGYTGDNCEEDFDECLSTPCEFNGTCQELSDQSLYGLGLPGFSHFSYATAAGYRCQCIDGITGANCETNINDCEEGACKNNATCNDGINTFTCDCAPGYEGRVCDREINECTRYTPCQNGATCTDLVADYSCSCLEFSPLRQNFGGKNCSVYLRGCDQRDPCRHGQCVPVLRSEAPLVHDYECRCDAGFSGRNCDVSTTVTLSSNGSLIRYTPPPSTNRQDMLSFRFRTTLTDTVLAVYQFSSSILVSVEIKDGNLCVVFRDNNSPPFSAIVDSQEHINNGMWHAAFLNLQHNVSLTLVSTACGSEQCVQQFAYPHGKPVTSYVTMYFGNMRADILDKTMTGRMYVGCLEDIVFNNTYLFHGQKDGEYINVTRQCPRSEQCSPYICHRQGRCVDLWDNFRCDCYRPYWGTQCKKEYTAATFQRNGVPSLAIFRLDSLSSTIAASGLDMSLFLQTRQRDSIIMYLTNEVTSPDALTFMTLEMHDGRLATRLSLCGAESYFSDNKISVELGWLNFVHVTFRNGSLLLLVNNSVCVNETLPQPPCDFQPSVVYFGKFPEGPVGRQRRQATVTPPPISQLQSYEGIIQDVQLQAYTLDFQQRADAQPNSSVPLSGESNVTLGALSTVIVCNMSNPCENGGTCTDRFFNDFECQCPEGYLGKNCSQPDFCKDNSCPDGSRCQSLQRGFECISVVSFNGVSSLVTYRPTLPSGLPSQRLSLHMRTRSFHGAVMEVRAPGQQNNFIKVRVRDGSLEVNYLLKSYGFSSSLRMLEPVNDGHWYFVEMDISATNAMSLRLSRNGTIIEEEGPEQLDDTVTDLSRLVESGTILVGDVADGKEQAFDGCLEEVRLGGVLLPFILETAMHQNTADQKFSATSLHHVKAGCEGSDACRGNLCVNGARCRDVWNDYVCDCRPGYEGEFCDSRVNECDAGGCLNGGVCLDSVGDYTCVCPAAFTGRRCETLYNACANNSCSNGSNCTVDPNVMRGYVCDCGDSSYSGDLCNVSIENKSCADQLCKNSATCSDDQNSSTFTCSCAPGYTGVLCESPINYCVSLPCNNGTCTSDAAQQNFTCDCSTGFSGDVCDTNIDDCAVNDCQNGATCVDGINYYTCDCVPGWTGTNCSVNVNECDSEVCQYGSCIDLSPGYRCDCTNTGYTGDNCSQDLDECEHEYCVSETSSNCTNREGNYTCDCKLGYMGANCSEAICDEGQCKNGSTCQIIDASWGTKWKCHCQKYFGGDFCDLAGPCAFDPCNGTYTKECLQNDDIFSFSNYSAANYTCECEDGWEGDLCSDDINECSRPDQCQNGGLCTNLPGSFNCTCRPGYTGRQCQTDINECASNPCLNNGNCTDGIANFTCNCTGTGYQGDTCSEDVDECQELAPCQNNATCLNSQGSFTCRCTGGYLGDRCQHQNPCVDTALCSNGGSCNSSWSQDQGAYLPSCTCVSGYHGSRCEQSPQSDDDIDIAVIIGPIVAVVLLCIIIGVIAFIMVARKKRATHGAYSPSRQETAGARVELGNVLKKPPEERLI